MLQKMDRLEGPGFGNVAGRRRLVYQADLHVADAGRRAIFEARAGGVGVEAGGAVEVDRAGDQDRAVAVIDTQSCVRRALHLDIAAEVERPFVAAAVGTAQRSEEHTSELQSLMRSSNAVFCLKKKKI